MKDSQKTKKQLLQEIQQLRQQLQSSSQSISAENILEIKKALSEPSLYQTFDNLWLMVCCFNPKFQITLVNDAFCRFFGREKEELLGQSFLINIPEKAHPFVISKLNAVSIENPNVIVEHQVINSKQEVVYQRWHNRCIFDEQGKIISYISTGEDITQRILAEQKLDDSQARFKALSDASFDAIFLSDKGICIYQNETAHKMFGYSDTEAIGRLGTEWIIPEDREIVFEYMKKGFEEPYEVTALRKDGSTFPCIIKAKMIDIEGRQIRFTALADSTELKKYKEDLTQNVVHFRTLIKTIPDMVWLKDPKGVYLSCNPRFESLYNTKEEDLVGKDDYSFVPPKLADFFQMHDQMAIANGKPTINEEELTFAADGHHELVETIKTPMYDPRGKLVGVLGIARDITKRKEIEEKLQKSEEKYRLLFHNMLNGFALHEMIFDDWGIPVDYRFVEVNDAFESMTGLKREHIIGQQVTEVIPGIEKDPADWICLYGKVVSENKPMRFEQYSQPLRKWFSVNAFKVADNMFATVFEDITVRIEHHITLEKEKERAQGYLDIAGVMFVVLDDQGTVTLINKKGCEVLGYKQNEIIGKNWFENFLSKEKSNEIIEIYNKIISGEIKGLETHENEIITKAGQKRTILWNNITLVDPDGNITGTLSSGEDITERNNALEALKKSDERFNLTMNATEEGLYDWDLITNEVYYSPAWKKMLGYEDDELDNTVEVWEQLTRPEDIQKSWDLMNDCFDGKKERYEFEFPMKHKDGHWVDILSLAHIVFDDTEKAVRVVGTHIDVTERNHYLWALKESDERFNLAVNASRDGLYDWDLTNNSIYYSPGWKRMLGYEDHELPDNFSVWSDLVDPKDAQRSWSMLKDLLDGKIKRFELEFKMKHKHGHWVDILSRATAIFDEKGTPIRVVGTHVDITERNRAEQALKEATLRELEIVKATNVGFWNWDVTTGEVVYSSVWKEQIGYKPNEIKNDFNEWKSRIHPDDLAHVEEKIQDCFKNTVTNTQIEFRFQHKDGSYHWIMSQASVIYDENRKPLRIRGTHIDITDHKNSERLVIESERKLRNYFDHAPIGIAVLDGEGKILEANYATINFSGYSLNELLLLNILDLVQSDSKEIAKAKLDKLFREGKISGEIAFSKKNGDVGYTTYDMVQIGEDRYLAFVNEITETKQLRELQSRAERLETAGTIAGQVAHDFNNLLGPIMAYPEFIREELPDNHNVRAYLDDIENAAQKIAEINQDLLTLGRRGHYNLDLLNLNSIISKTVEEMKKQCPTVNFEINLDKELMNIKGGGAQIHRMLINLLSNARDAIQDAGNIIVSTENYYADDTSFAYGRVPRGEYVKITITDDGCGIPEEIIQRILDPFFSTKTADKKRGSGLGLSVVDAVMKDHHGFIDLSSKVGYGTSFYLYFPITREDIELDEKSQPLEGTESVLIIDDDAVQREVSLTLLKKLGYHVSCAESGEQALEILLNASYDILVLDMVMPDGIDGTETYRRALEMNPDQKAIIVSGFAESERVREAKQLGVRAFVKKPLTKIIIGRAIRNELDRHNRIKA